MLPYFNSPSLVGLDMNAEEIRLLQLRRVKNEIFVENFVIINTPSGAVQDGKILDFERLGEALGQLVKQTKTAGLCAAAALPASLVISRRIKLAAGLQPEEYEFALTANFHHYFPGLQDALCFDYVVLAAGEVLLVASRLEQLKIYTEVIQRAGLKIKILDVDTYALARAAFLLSPHAVTGLLDMAADTTQFILFQNNNIIFNQLWHSLTENVLAAEINRAIQFCSASHELEKCLVSGLVGKMKDFFTAETAIKFIEVNPLDSFKLAKHIDSDALKIAAPRLMLCCGLAMRRIPTW